jgi:mono/diheme cytochrome c family protein
VTLWLAGLAVSGLFVLEIAMLARFLGWGRGAGTPGTPGTTGRGGEAGAAARPRWLWAGPLVLGIAIAVPSLLLARGGGLAPGVSGAGMPWEDVTDATPAEQSAAWGERAYLNRCSPCHLPEGTGLPPSYPPLAGSHVLTDAPVVHARVALWGSDGVAHHHPGVAQMPAFAGVASDAELAAILTYERARWAPAGTPHVRPSDVARARAEGALAR